MTQLSAAAAHAQGISTYESRIPQRMRPSHYKILECEFLGMSIDAIASQVKTNVTTVILVRRMPQYQQALELMRHASREHAVKLIADQALASVRHIIAVRDNPDISHGLRLRAAMTLLDRFMPTSTRNAREEDSLRERPLFDAREMLKHIHDMRDIPELHDTMQQMLAELRDSLTDAAIESQVEQRLIEQNTLEQNTLDENESSASRSEIAIQAIDETVDEITIE